MQKINKKYSMINTQLSIFSFKYSKILFAYCLLPIAYCLLPVATFAQKDTGKKTSTIDINSVYKPVLRNAVKINFSAAHLDADT